MSAIRLRLLLQGLSDTRPYETGRSPTEWREGRHSAAFADRGEPRLKPFLEASAAVNVFLAVICRRAIPQT